MNKDYIIKERHRVAEVIKARREDLSMTQEELAQKSGMSRITINRIENCVFSPNADQLYIICKVLGINIVFVPNEGDNL